MMTYCGIRNINFSIHIEIFTISIFEVLSDL